MAFISAVKSWWASLSGESPPPKPVQGDLSLDSFADDLRDSLGSAVDLPPGGPAPSEEEKEVWDDGGPEATFAGIAANYAQPIKDFVFDLKRGTATKDWIEVCMPVLGSLIHGAGSLELDTVVERMTEFSDALARAEAEEGRGFDEASRSLILSRYDALARTMPTTFEAGKDCRRRESIIIHSLLRQLPEVGHVTFEKLYGAGLTSLDVLLMANAEDMSATTDVPVWLCEQICRKLRDYKKELDGATEGSASAKVHHERLAELLDELKRHHRRLQEVADEGSAKDKREALGDRRECMLKIDVLLADLGEVNLVEQMRTIAVERRIEELERYLGPAAAGAAGQAHAGADNSAGNG